MLHARERKILTKCGTWVADQMVKESAEPVGSTMTARGSIALGMSRWLV